MGFLFWRRLRVEEARSPSQPHAQARAALHEQERQEPQSPEADRHAEGPKPQGARQREVLPGRRLELSPAASQPPAEQAVLPVWGAEEAESGPGEHAS